MIHAFLLFICWNKEIKFFLKRRKKERDNVYITGTNWKEFGITYMGLVRRKFNREDI